jgi:Tol biopolymer transport system component
VSWSSDGSLLAYVSHEGDQEGGPLVDSPSFGLWAASAGGDLKIRLAEDVGMWAAPRWAPVANGPLAFGQAQSPHNSQDSRYEVVLSDRDGSNMRHLYPANGQLGLVAPDLAWSPDGSALLFADQGNLFVVSASTGDLVQLTSDGQGSHPRWAR